MNMFCNLSCLVAALLLSSESAKAQSILEPNKNEAAITLTIGEVTALGRYLTTKDGRAVYMFTSDQGGKPTCAGPCAKDWAPVTTRSDVSAGEGVDAGKIGTVHSEGGARQATYAGHPLYYFIHDAGGRGATTGQAVKAYAGDWYLLDPEGKPITGKRPGEFPRPQDLRR